jgi:Flp pilus assembly protein TadB
MAIVLKEVEQRSKSNSHRLDEVEKRQADNDKMLASIARMDQRQNDMDNDIKEIKTDVKTLTGKPGKRWENVVDKVVFTIVAALVAYILARVGLS